MILNINYYMQKILKSLNCDEAEEMRLVNSEQLHKLFFPPFIRVYDCVIISDEEINLTQNAFATTVKKLYGDWSGYEFGNTEVRINDYFKNALSKEEGTQIALWAIKRWIPRLHNMEPQASFAFFLFSNDERTEIRFHKLRNDESLVVTDVDSYKDGGVAVIIAGRQEDKGTVRNH